MADCESVIELDRVGWSWLELDGVGWSVGDKF